MAEEEYKELSASQESREPRDQSISLSSAGSTRSQTKVTTREENTESRA